ncbi:hypothetical protein GCM10028791_18290 [Echinicola sediminis]
MKQIIGYVIALFAGFLVLMGIPTLVYMYLTHTNLEHLLTLNVLLILAIGLFQMGLYLISAKKRLNLIPSKNVGFTLLDKKINVIAWKRQINVMNITGVVIGVLNLILFMTSNYDINPINLIAVGGLTYPIFGYFETSNAIKKNFSNMTVEFIRNGEFGRIKLDDKVIDFKITDLVNTQLIDNYIFTQNSRTREILIIQTDII